MRFGPEQVLEATGVSREKVLEGIRAAEAERKRTEEEALRRKEEIVRDAQVEARRILERARQEAEAKAAAFVGAEAAKVEEERRRAVLSGQREVARQREASSARLNEAVDRLYKEFLRQVDAQTP
jgi:vacuolar-type H+-ATPase subunit H